LLRYTQNKNEISDRSFILKKLWGTDDFFNARSMDVFITKLRKKLKNDENIQIVNVRGYGYKLIC
jgi:DNA-binding response OmpR family regulator